MVEEEKEKEIKEEKKIVEAVKEKKDEKKVEEKKEEKKKTKREEKPKKTEAVVNGKDLPMSTKYSIAICNLIRKKKIDKAINELEKVTRKEKAIPMALELPHRKGMERGRYPVNASRIFIKLLKSLQANCQVNGLEEPYIFSAIANKASQPFRRAGQRFKRTHIYLEAREIGEKKGKEKAEEIKK